MPPRKSPALMGTIPPAERLAAKIARLQQLRAENAADHRPSFVAMLARAG